MKSIIANGLFWVSVSMTLVRGARYLAFFVVAGLISPADFGMFAELTVIVIGLTLLQGFGLGQALIFRKKAVEESSDTIFFLSLGLGTLFLCAGWIGAPLFERFFQEEGLTNPLRVYLFVVLLRAFQTVPIRLFEKELNFRKKFLPGLVGSLSYTVITIVLAFRGAGLWALVIGEVCGTIGEVITCWIISPWKPRLRFDISIAREDLKFGWAVLGGTALIFIFQSIDRVAISRFLGSNELGYYVFAFTIASLPETYFVRVFNTVLFPSYTRDGLGRPRQKALFFRAASYCCALGLIFTIGVIAFSEYFLEAAYGDKWLPSVAPLFFLAFFGFFRAMSALTQDLIIAVGRPGIFRTLNGIRVVPALILVYFGITMGGITGVAIVMTFSTLVSFIVGWIVVKKLLSASIGDFRRYLSGPLLAGVPATLLALGTLRILPEENSLPWVLVAGIVVLVFYFFSWLAFDKSIRQEWKGRLTRDRAENGNGL